MENASIATRNIPIVTKFGSTFLSLSDETKAFTHAEHRGWSTLVVDDIAYLVRVGLQCVDGKWIVTRTEAGNESPSALDVRAHGRDLVVAGKKIRDAVRAAVLEAVNAHLIAHPEIVAQARLTRVEQAFQSVEKDLAQAQIRVKALIETRAKLLAECQDAVADVVTAEILAEAQS